MTDYLLILINLLTISFFVLDIVARVQLTPLIFFFQSVAPLLLFPVYLIFALEAVQHKIVKTNQWIWFFVPSLVSTIFFTSDLFFSNHYSFEELQKLYEEPPTSYHIVYKGNQIVFLVSLGWLLTQLRKYSRQIKEQFSFIDPIRLNWLRQTTWGYFVTTLVILMIFITSNFQWIAFDIHTAYSLVSFCIVLLVFYASFHGIGQYTAVEVYGRAAADSVATTEPLVDEQPQKYKASSLTSEEQNDIFQNLVALFETQKKYLEPKVQLQEVADALQVSTHRLSQTINSITGKTFYDFVNGYRVKHLQKLLSEPSNKKFTILAMGLESGFNSKASLNRIFKDETGLSPKEYQQKCSANLTEP